MYHPTKKSKELIRRVAVYTLMSISVVFLLVILVFFMLGYRFNRADGKIEQGGLVQFDTQPEGSIIKLDGAALATKTPGKLTIATGAHTVSMSREGYRTWSKNVSLAAGQILWLNYARLIPNNLQPTSVHSYKSLASTLPSPDKHWMATVASPDKPVIELADLSGDSVRMTTLELPSTSYNTAAAGFTPQFSLESWAADSRFFLVKHTYAADKADWIVVDRTNPGASINITGTLGIEATRIIFNGDDANILYAQVGSEVRRIDVKAATLSRPLMTNVAEFSLYDKTMLVYTSLPAASTNVRTVGYYRDGTAAARSLRTFDGSDKPLHLAIGKYFNETYVAIAYGETLEISKGDLPSGGDVSALTPVATIVVPGGSDSLTIKDERSGRFIVAQKGSRFVTYDLELLKASTTTIAGTSDTVRTLGWLDSYIAWSDRDGRFRLYEFDGANQQDIGTVAEGYTATLSPNERYLYYFTATTGGGFQLERVRLIL